MIITCLLAYFIYTMRGVEMKEKLYHIAHFITFLFFSYVLVRIIPQSIQTNRLILSFLFLFFSFFLLGNLYVHSYSPLRIKVLSEDFLKNRVLQLIPAVFVIQLVLAYLLAVDTLWDPNRIYEDAVSYVTKGIHMNRHYFARYPNNLFILYIVIGIYYLSYHLFHTTSIYVLIIVNIILIDLSIFLMYKIVDLLWGKKWAYMTVMICSVCAPFYLYIPIVYTDTFVLPFLTLSIYLIMKSLKENHSKKKMIYSLCSGVVLYLDYKMKPSQIVVLIAVFIFYFLRMKTKEFFKASVSVLAGVILTAVIYASIFPYMNFITEEEYNQLQFPTTHWIMMALTGKGGYRTDEADYTASFPTYEEKKEANIARIKERVDDYGFVGLLKHTDVKLTTYTWNDGLFNAPHFLEGSVAKPIRKNILHEFILTRGNYFYYFYAYAQSTYWILLLFLLLSVVCGIFERTKSTISLLRIAIIGGGLFYVIWETSPRYILQYYPMIIIVAVDGIRKSTKWLQKIREDRFDNELQAN